MSDRILVMQDGRIAGELPAGSTEEQVLRMATGVDESEELAAMSSRPAARLTSTGIVCVLVLLSVVVAAILTAMQGRNFFSSATSRHPHRHERARLHRDRADAGDPGRQPRPVGAVRRQPDQPGRRRDHGRPERQRRSRRPGRSRRRGRDRARQRSDRQLLHVHGFIATLGMGLVISGYLAINYKGSHGSAPRVFRLIGATQIGPVPLSTVIMLAAQPSRSCCCGVPASATASTPSAATPRWRGSPASAPPCRSSSRTCCARCWPASPGCCSWRGSASAARRSAPRAATT